MMNKIQTIEEYRLIKRLESDLEYVQKTLTKIQGAIPGVIDVDELSPSTLINSKDELDPKKYGVIVEEGLKRGVLLPDLDGVDTIDEQISIAKQKAGIKENEEVELQRFEVERHK